MAENLSLPNSALLALPDDSDDRPEPREHSGREIRDWTSHKVQALQRHLSNIRALHNSTLMVNSLPNEILVEVFHIATAMRDSVAWTTKVMGVCRYWRDLFARTPLLWSTIDLSKQPEFIDLCLARSDDTAIRLYLRMQLSRHGVPIGIDYPAIASLLAPHHPRISYVDLYVNRSYPNHHSEDSQALLRTLEAPLPGLMSMALTAGPECSLKLTQNHLPHLRNLSLSGLTIAWTSLPLPNLTSLRLSDVAHPDDRHHGCLASLLDVLEACDGLERFTYEQWEAVAGIQPVATDRVVSLPCMQHFFISGLPRDISEILAHLSLPRGARLSVELLDLQAGEITDFEHLPVLDAVLPCDVTRLPTLRDVRHVMVRFEHLKLTVHADEDRSKFWESQAWKASGCKPPPGPDAAEDVPVIPSLCMVYHLPGSEFDDYLLPSVMCELSSFFPSTLETLLIRGVMDVVDTETWTQLLTAFPDLEHLEIMSEACDMKSFPQALEPTPAVTPCPRLRKLALRYEPNEEDGGRKLLTSLYTVLQKRDAAQTPLESLSLQVEPVADDTAFTPSGVIGRLPSDFDDIQADLESMVDSLEVMLLIDGDQ